MLFVHTQFHAMTLIVVVRYSYIQPKPSGETLRQPTSVAATFRVGCAANPVLRNLHTVRQRNTSIIIIRYRAIIS